jgi:PLP dependent protein
MSGESGSQDADEQHFRSVLDSIRQRMDAACERAGRSKSGVKLIAVSKTVNAAYVRIAINAGVTILGENRVQEAEPKMSELSDLREQVEWHLIGHLQSNKARKAVTLFDAVQSVDDEELALRLNRLADESGKRLPILIEVNLGEEISKAGTGKKQVFSLIEKVAQLESLELQGLMTVPPFLDDPEAVRPFFRELRKVRDEALRLGLADQNFVDLSMGMSHDFEVAIEEGATFVRIGTALFGARN